MWSVVSDQEKEMGCNFKIGRSLEKVGCNEQHSNKNYC